MARYYEIPLAFKSSITIEPGGRRIVRTEDFVRELAKINHHFTLEQANRWIENYQSSFSDITPDNGENRVFHMFSPYGGF